MDGLFFLLSIIGTGLVMLWMIRNDKIPPDGATTGLFALPHAPAPKRGGPFPRPASLQRSRPHGRPFPRR